MNLKEAFLFYSLKLKQENINNYEFETRLLLKQVLNITDSSFILNPDMLINQSQKQNLDKIFSKRASKIPLAYLITKQFFWRHDFYVNENVLIPRLDSETMVVAFLDYFPKQSEITILEIGVGSGCLLLSILSEYPKAKGIGVDISSSALKVCKINASNLNLLDRTNLIQSNIFENVKGSFNVIISNPPYISENDKDLSFEVRNFEPNIALFAANNGLFFYQEILKESHKYLKKEGLLFFEIGYTQNESVRAIASANNYQYLQTRKDLSNRDRVIIFQS